MNAAVRSTADLIATAVAPILPAWRAAAWPARADMVNAWIEHHNAAVPGQREKVRVLLQAMLDALGKAPDVSCIEAVMLYLAGCDAHHQRAAAAEIRRYADDTILDFLDAHRAIRPFVLAHP